MTNTAVADPSPHLALIHRVVNQMGFSGTDAEEAFSEGLVAITVAAKRYDPGKGVPLANWLGKNIRWSLQNWRNSQHQYKENQASNGVTQLVVHGLMESQAEHTISKGDLSIIGSLNQSTIAHLENHVLLKQAIEKMSKILEPMEYKVLVLHALEWQGTEIASYLGVTTVAVSRLKKKAQRKMTEALL